jgi:hypothetical protein
VLIVRGVVEYYVPDSNGAERGWAVWIESGKKDKGST